MDEDDLRELDLCEIYAKDILETLGFVAEDTLLSGRVDDWDEAQVVPAYA